MSLVSCSRCANTGYYNQYNTKPTICQGWSVFSWNKQSKKDILFQVFFYNSYRNCEKNRRRGFLGTWNTTGGRVVVAPDTQKSRPNGKGRLNSLKGGFERKNNTFPISVNAVGVILAIYVNCLTYSYTQYTQLGHCAGAVPPAPARSVGALFWLCCCPTQAPGGAPPFGAGGRSGACASLRCSAHPRGAFASLRRYHNNLSWKLFELPLLRYSAFCASSCIISLCNADSLDISSIPASGITCSCTR